MPARRGIRRRWARLVDAFYARLKLVALRAENME